MLAKTSSSNPEMRYLSFILSDTIVDILLRLSEGDIIDIGCAGSKTPDSLSCALEKLTEDWLVIREGNSFRLSHSGQILATQISDFLHSLQMLIPGNGSPDMQANRVSSLRNYYQRNYELIFQVLQLPLYSGLPTRDCDAENAHVLKHLGLLEESKGMFSVTPRGYRVISLIHPLANAIGTIEKFVDFFETHSWESVPEFAVGSIGNLIESELVCDIPLNFNQGFDFYLKIIEEAGHIHGVSSWSRPHIADAIWEKAVAGAEVELIITRELAVDLFNDSSIIERARELKHLPNLKFRVSKIPVKVGLTVTDKSLSFGLFTRDGVIYDSIYDLVCSSGPALEWGERLFDYYRTNSIPMSDFFMKNYISSVARKIFSKSC
jgi:predicted transcriptional regulator